MDFDEVNKGITSLGDDHNSDSFHRIISDMLGYLEFSFKESWFEVGFVGIKTKVQVPKLIDVVYSYGKIPNVKDFARREKFCKGLSFVISTTFHASSRSLLASDYSGIDLMSNSSLGLGNKVMDIEEVNKVFENSSKDPIMLAFDRGHILRSNDSSSPYYFLHPNSLYYLCLRKKGLKVI